MFDTNKDKSLNVEISQTMFMDVLAEMEHEGVVKRGVICSKDLYHDLPANEHRLELYASMFARHGHLIEKQLEKIPLACSKLDSELRTLARELLSKIKELQDESAVIASVTSLDHLEQFLSHCGQLAYESPVVATVVTRLEVLYKTSLQCGEFDQARLFAAQSKGWIVNLMIKRNITQLKHAVKHLGTHCSECKTKGQPIPDLPELTMAIDVVDKCVALEAQLKEALSLKNLNKLDAALQVTAALKYKGRLADDAFVMRDTVSKLATGILFEMGVKARGSEAHELAKYHAQAKSLGIESPRVTQVGLLLVRCQDRCQAEINLSKLEDFIDLTKSV